MFKWVQFLKNGLEIRFLHDLQVHRPIIQTNEFFHLMISILNHLPEMKKKEWGIKNFLIYKTNSIVWVGARSLWSRSCLLKGKSVPLWWGELPSVAPRWSRFYEFTTFALAVHQWWKLLLWFLKSSVRTFLHKSASYACQGCQLAFMIRKARVEFTKKFVKLNLKEVINRF